MQTTKFAKEFLIPKFKAVALPPLGCVRIFTFGCDENSFRTFSKVESLLPSSTKMILKFS